MPSKSSSKKSWSDILFPCEYSFFRSGTFHVVNFEHVMGGFWVLVGALGREYFDDDRRFYYWSIFVGIMMIQCGFTGFSPPRIVMKNLLGIADENGVIICGKKRD